MSTSIPEYEVLSLLHAVERGECRPVFLPGGSPFLSVRDMYVGDGVFRIDGGAFDGWQIVVFDDCDEWDYIDSVIAPDGRKLDFDAIRTMPELYRYKPPEGTLQDMWGFK